MKYMNRALKLARCALGTTSPNPAVGAVIVNNNNVVGEGFTQPYGGLHAEIEAIRQAGTQAKNSTIYVTLEPHCFQGNTPSCTAAIINAGVREVHIAALDPNPRVNGLGKKELENAGLKVRILAMALIVPLALTACGDATGVEEDHGEEVEGVQIWLSGAMIRRTTATPDRGQVSLRSMSAQKQLTWTSDLLTMMGMRSRSIPICI